MNAFAYLNDDGKLKRKYINKRVNANKEDIDFNLSFEEYCALVAEAGLLSSNLGFSGDNYVLARYNDTGGYEYGNCRFITQKENMQEQKTSEKTRKAARINLQKTQTPEAREKARITNSKTNSRWNQHCQKLKEQAIINRIQKEASMDKRYIGIHNSQYGSFWITDGEENKKWRSEKGEIPPTFYKGRTIDKSSLS